MALAVSRKPSHTLCQSKRPRSRALAPPQRPQPSPSAALAQRLPQPRGVVFFLHGNAGNVSYWVEAAAVFHGLGWNTLRFFKVLKPEQRRLEGLLRQYDP